MGESKYGRLFTEADVLTLLRCGGFVSDAPLESEDVRGALESALEVADAVRPLTFPADEPLFLLRAQDKAAPRAIATEDEKEQEYGGYGDYYTASLVAGAEDEHLYAVAHAAAEMYDWQRANPHRVKVPD